MPTTNGSGKPTSLTLRTYQVGFGDCFLLTFHYPKRDKHMLIDFGSTKMAPKGPTMQAIANDIAKVTNNKLDVVVATHRHKDHISGFGGKPGKTILGLAPDAVLQPWTEHPKAARDATKAPSLMGVRGLRAAHVSALAAMQIVSGAVVDEVRRLGLKGSVAQQLRFVGEDNIQNPDAVKNLMKMKGPRYLAYGDDPRLGRILPGVKVRVIGPPTLEQSADIKRQRSKDAEYWHLRVTEHAEFWAAQKDAATSGLNGAEPLFAPKYRSASIPLEAQWFRNRLRRSRGDELLQIVRALDTAMNNTSLILLLQVGKRTLLFPGDAQIENWQYALDQAKKVKALGKLLKDVDVYKVGHHGSLNATPKSLWNGFAHGGPKTRKSRLQTFMSTLPDKHGDPDSKTEVPRRSLVTELTRKSTLVRTDKYRAGEVCTVTPITV